MGSIVRVGGTTSSADAYLSEPAVPGPAVLVVHDEFGLLPHVRQRCDSLAEAGFVGLAPDLYAGEATRDRGIAAQLAEGLDIARARITMSAAAAQLRALPKVQPERVGAVGFSAGGRLVLLAASGGGLDAVVSYYGLPHADDQVSVPCPVLLQLADVAGRDAPELAERSVAGLTIPGSPVTARTWPGTTHWFANADTGSYAAVPARAAWAETLAFLAGHLRL